MDCSGEEAASIRAAWRHRETLFDLERTVRVPYSSNALRLIFNRLYDDRLAQLNKEEAMLKQSKPTHPELLAMLKCLEDKRDERIRVANKRRELDMQTLKVFAVAGRSQILSQYQQEVRESREQHVEQVGKQWYEIQHDRRSYAGSVPDYTIKFPSKRPQQVQNQVAYSTEVSVLAGISKYVGFPAAPPMRPATTAEIEEDFAKMGVSSYFRDIKCIV